MRRPAFILTTEDTTPEQLKAKAREALSTFVEAVEATHDEQPTDQHQQ